MEPSRVFAALADLAPAAGDRVTDVTRGGQPLIWLAEPERAPRRRDVDRLAALDALHRDERVLRRGWGIVAGRQEADGGPRRVRVPLLSQPVRLERTLGGYRLVPAGDLAVTPLVADRRLAAAMEAAPGLGGPGWLTAIGTRAWLESVAGAAGLRIDRVTGPARRPAVPGDGLALVVGAALFVVRDVFGTALGDSLRSWAGRPGLADTALAALYAPGPPTGPPDPPAGPPDAARTGEEPPVSPLPLTDAQATVVLRARSQALTVVSGPPGNGKSHAVVAAALDVVHRGGSVLVATQSSHAADVLAGLLARHPGPTPVLFGDAERRTALAAELAAGLRDSATAQELRADRAAVDAARRRAREACADVAAALDTEARAATLSRWEPLLAGLAADVPGAFDDAVPLPAAGDLTGRPAGASPGAGDAPARWWARWRAAAAQRRARRLLRAADGVPLDRVTDAVTAAEAQRSAARLAATGGTAPDWDALHRAEEALARAAGDAMRRAVRGADRWTPRGRRGAAALSAAVRTGRNRRREMLAALDGPPLVRALPLWIGTVADVEDLLPPVPGLFDLVVLDEASHVDQVRAAPVLARARRALIAGDPRQLRFVSFVGDDEVAAVLARHGADDRLDVRRVSAFDLAAGAASVTWLDEHHRCVPRLIEFSAGRFYAGRMAVTTRHPRTEAAAAVDVVRVSGTVSDGVNAAEVTAVLDVVRGLAAAGCTGIGVVSPFRAQADALELALLDAFPVDLVERLGLRVGTVHAFQGSEADIVVASLGVVPEDATGRHRFLADPHLFNVLVTRARHRMIVVTSLAAADGLVGDYLAAAEAPPVPPPPVPAPGGCPDSGWTLAVRDELHRLGVPVRLGYPTGRWRVDLCVGPADVAVGVLCGVHPGGAAAHLSRQRALRRAGWRLLDAFPSRWGGDPRRAALEIAAELPQRADDRSAVESDTDAVA